MKVLYKVKIKLREYGTIYRLVFAQNRDVVYKLITNSWQNIDSLTIERYKLNRKYKHLYIVEGDK